MGSTNDWLRAHAAGLPDGQWVRADRQSGGRGRLGRHWEMPAGNLAASCLLRPTPAEGKPAELGFVAALALFDCCVALVAADRLRLKWPNDLLLDGAKLSGILLEREGDVLILGIGVNIAAAPKLADRPTVSLADASVAIGADAFLDRLAAAFGHRRQAWSTGGFATVRADWLARAHPPGTVLTVVQGGHRLEGRFVDLDSDGALLLEDAQGLHRIHAGDVWEQGRA